LTKEFPLNFFFPSSLNASDVIGDGVYKFEVEVEVEVMVDIVSKISQFYCL